MFFLCLISFVQHCIYESNLLCCRNCSLLTLIAVQYCIFWVYQNLCTLTVDRHLSGDAVSYFACLWINMTFLFWYIPKRKIFEFSLNFITNSCIICCMSLNLFPASHLATPTSYPPHLFVLTCLSLWLTTHMI